MRNALHAVVLCLSISLLVSPCLLAQDSTKSAQDSAQTYSILSVGIPPQEGAQVIVAGKLTTPEGTSLNLENNTVKDVVAVQLAWTIAPAVSCNSALLPTYKVGEVQKVNLIHGTSLSIKAPAEIQTPKLLEVAKNGAVKVLVVNVGILEATFSDGSKWTDETLAATKQFMNGEVERNTPCEAPTPKKTSTLLNDRVLPSKHGQIQLNDDPCQSLCGLSVVANNCYCVQFGSDSYCYTYSCSWAQRQSGSCPDSTCQLVCIFGH
jgi:hypothetical protein